MTVETVRAARYGQLVRPLRLAPKVYTVSCYGLYDEPDRTKFLLKSKKTRTVNTVSTVLLPVSLRFLPSPDRRNTIRVIQALAVMRYNVIKVRFPTLRTQRNATQAAQGPAIFRQRKR